MQNVRSSARSGKESHAREQAKKTPIRCMANGPVLHSLSRPGLLLSNLLQFALGYLALDKVADQAPGALDKSNLVCQTCLEENTNRVIAGEVCCRRQGHVLAYPKVGEVTQLCQDKDVPGNRSLDLTQFFAEVIYEGLLQASTELHWLLACQFEALIQRF